MIKSLLFFLIFFSFAAFSQPKMIFLGDSLTEGFGVEKESAYPSLLQRMFNEEKVEIKIINAGVSGSTSASGVSRLKWLLKSKPDYLFLALGANDGLRGVKLSETKKNLEDIIKLAFESKIKVLFAGMLLPTNYGENYREGFQKIFKEIADEFKLPYYPFLLDKVGGKKELNIADGMHPNEEGHKILAKEIYPFIKKNL